MRFTKSISDEAINQIKNSYCDSFEFYNPNSNRTLGTYVFGVSLVLLFGSFCPFSFLEGDFGFSEGMFISSIFRVKSLKI